MRLIVALLLLAVTDVAAQAPDSLRSAFLRGWAPTLAPLAAGSATDAFWRDVASRHTPIVERIPGDPRFVHVTFLYHGRPDTRSAAVIALENHQLANRQAFELGRLSRLGSTDVWYRTYRLRGDARFTYRISVDDDRVFAELSDSAWQQRLRALTRDPLNPRDTVTRDGAVSLVELPDAPPLRWFAAVPGTPGGRVDSARVGRPGAGLDRAVTVYTPPGYSRATGAQNLLIVLDGEGIPSYVPLTTILDNLHASGRLGPTVAVTVANRPGKRVVDLSYSAELLSYVRDELLPWVRAHYAVPRDPRRVVVAGRSASAATAVWLAFELPSLVGNAISQSADFGAFRPGGPLATPPSIDGFTQDDFPERQWLVRAIATSPKRPIRLHLEIGTLEDVIWEGKAPTYTAATGIASNRHMRDVLDAKGYAFTYHEYNGPHDSIVWRGTLGDALLELLPRGDRGPATGAAAPASGSPGSAHPAGYQ